jgi:hypothetical protein
VGISAVPGGNELRVEVPWCESLVEGWRSPLVPYGENAKVGVSIELANGILDGLCATAAGRLGGEILRVSEAACGFVGSSQNFMAKLARSSIEILLLDVVQETALCDLMEGILLKS